MYNINTLQSNNILFSNFWDIGKIPNYNTSLLPGKKEGINGSCIHGFNIGISKYISNERINAAIEILKFITSERIQKLIIEKFNVYSALSNLYDDSEVCSFTNCKFVKEIQSIERPVTKYDDYDRYSSKISKIINNFIHNLISVEETVNEINDITKIYYYSIKSNVLSYIMFVLYMITFFFIILSAVILFIPSLKKYFTFLSVDLWILYTIGSLVFIVSEVTKFGELSNFKCQSSRVMMTSGYTMILIPMLYKLIVNFPQINKYSTWVKNNKYIFISLILCTEFFLNSLYFISPIETVVMSYENSKNYIKCIYTTGFNLVLTILQISTKFITYISICILIFLEWNIEETYNDIRALTVIMCMDGVLLVLFFIIHFANINDYVTFYSIHTCIILLFTIINHVYIFVIRIWFESSTNEKSVQDKLEDKLFDLNNNNNNNNNLSDILGTCILDNSENEDESSRKNSKNSQVYKSKLLNIHFATRSNTMI